jgi:hypothetical protein
MCKCNCYFETETFFDVAITVQICSGYCQQKFDFMFCTFIKYLCFQDGLQVPDLHTRLGRMIGTNIRDDYLTNYPFGSNFNEVVYCDENGVK